MDRLAAIEAFIAVADEHGFTQAAQRLGVSKSVVSKQVSALEQHLGVRLFNRTTRNLSLTEAGARFYAQSTGIVEQLVEAEQAVGDLNASPRGLLRVNVPVSFGHLHLGPAMPEFLSRYPDIEVDITLNDRLVDLVNEGFDAAIRISRLEDSSLIARRVATAHGWVCASPEYIARHGAPRHPGELAAHNCLVYTYARQGQDWILVDRQGNEHRVPVRGRLRANNGEFLLETAAAGMGLVIMPDFIIADSVDSGRMQRVLPEYTARELGVYAVYPYTRHVSAKVRVFVDFLVERFGEQGLDWRRAALRA